MSLKVIIFDFDGVILESSEIKTESFGELFQRYPDKVEEIVSYHLENEGISRFKKFDYIYKEILEIDLTKEMSSELGKEFSRLVFDRIVTTPFIEGAQEFLSEYGNILPLYIASGTPQEELRKISEIRNISQYFKMIYGTPALKQEIIKIILKEESILPENALFVGDAMTDYNAAMETNVPFLGRIKNNNASGPFDGLDIPVIGDFNGLSKFVEDKINDE